MSLQVNLLKKSERRYQGIVSMKLMVLGSASVLLGVMMLVLALAGISKMTLTANLERARKDWVRLEPLSLAVRAQMEAVEANKKTLASLDEWSQGDRAKLFQVLRSVQEKVPGRMQLHNLFAGVIDDPEAKKSFFVVRMSGRAQGELTAVDTKHHFNNNRDIRSFCGEVKLIASQRETGDSWTFAMEGRREAEGVRK